MRYRDAVKLHSGDEVQVKETGAFVHVIEVDIEDKFVLLFCTDGLNHYHDEVR